MHIKIGTRNSLLALWQANYVAALLNKQGISSTLIPIESKGDKILQVSLSKIGSKGVFTQELEDMLRKGEIDIAVHSAKDVQSHLPEDLELLAFTERECVEDVVVSYDSSKRISDTHTSYVIGTSSTRRVAFLRHYYPQHTVVDMRGNLQTRFKKLENGSCDMMLLAYAGVHRMQLSNYIAERLAWQKFIPAVGQGSVAIQCVASLSPQLKETIQQAANHQPTEICLKAERAFLYHMQGGCSVPVFCYAQLLSPYSMFIIGGIIKLDGSQMVLDMKNVPIHENVKAGEILAKKVLKMGGGRILEEIKFQLGKL